MDKPLVYLLSRQWQRRVAMFGKDNRWKHLSGKPTLRWVFPYESSKTPVPIPNTEVKPLNADNSVSEDRKLPRIFFVYKKIKKKILQGIFFQLYLYENSFKRIELSLKEGREAYYIAYKWIICNIIIKHQMNIGL